jgi:hypothetical protein
MEPIQRIMIGTQGAAASPQRHCTIILRGTTTAEMNITAISGTTRLNLN